MKKSLHLLLAALLVTVGACNDDPLETDPVTGPVADAGMDRTVEDDDGNDEEVVLLDGSGSTAGDAAIATYAWSEGGVDIFGTTSDGGRTLSAAFDVGAHDVLLTVTDAAGHSDTDNVLITVEAQATVPPTVTIVAPVDLDEFDEGADVTFEGNAVDQFSVEVPPEDLEWMSELDGVLGTGNALTVNTLSVGGHVITLTAVDSEGLDGRSTITITVNEVLDVVSYAADIQPYLNTNCTACHGATLQQLGVRLDSYAATMTAGDNGATVVPGDATMGTLMARLNAGHQGAPHGTTIVTDTESWITAGADDN